MAYVDEYNSEDNEVLSDPKALKILRIYQMLQRTDADHPIMQKDIVDRLLEKYDICVERKAVARDLKHLEAANDLHVVKCGKGWYISDGLFKDHEVKILMDAIGAASFLDYDTSKSIITKLKTLSSDAIAEAIDNTVVLDKGTKLDDPQFPKKIKNILTAIAENSQIKFQYYDEVSGKRRIKNKGRYYEMSPYFVILANNDYYLVANMVGKEFVTHFKITRIVDVKITGKPRKKLIDVPELKDITSREKIAEYIHQHPNVFTGQNTTEVNLVCKEWCGSEILKEFGNTTTLWPRPDGTFSAKVRISNPNGFYYWLAKYGPEIVIENCPEIKKGYVEFLKSTLAMYE